MLAYHNFNASNICWSSFESIFLLGASHVGPPTPYTRVHTNPYTSAPRQQTFYPLKILHKRKPKLKVQPKGYARRTNPTAEYKEYEDDENYHYDETVEQVQMLLIIISFAFAGLYLRPIACVEVSRMEESELLGGKKLI